MTITYVVLEIEWETRGGFERVSECGDRRGRKQAATGRGGQFLASIVDESEKFVRRTAFCPLAAFEPFRAIQAFDSFMLGGGYKMHLKNRGIPFIVTRDFLLKWSSLLSSRVFSI